MNTLDVGNDFQTKAGCFQSTADELQVKLNQATLALEQAGTGDARKIGGYLFSTMILRALAAECALKALSVKSTGDYVRCHDLLKLYDNLTQDVQVLVDSIAEAQGVASLKTIMAQHRGDFVDWRYSSGDGRILSANFTDLQRALEVLIATLNHEQFL